MTKDKAKAEAEKIKEMLTKPFLQEDFEGIEYSTVGNYEIYEISIIHVKGVIEQIKLMYPHVHYGSELKRWQSILTELENQ